MITSRDKALKAVQKVQLEGLMEIDRICRKHGISYSLGGGTCLGQVRHGGFIPWDDDIDVDMTADNYDRFITVASTELDTSRFRLYTRESDPGIYRSYARLGVLDTDLSLRMWQRSGYKCNIFVEIFKCSYLPDDEKKRREIATKLFLTRCIQHYKELGLFAVSLDPKYKLKVKILGTLLPASLLQKYEDRLTHCTKGKTGWLIDNTLVHGNYGGYPARGVDEYKDVQFEGHTVMGKSDPHEFLTALYGTDYMNWLPPLKRFSHHDWASIDLGHFAEMYGIDTDYKDYMTAAYTPAKLRQMQLVSEYIVKQVVNVCEKQGINYAEAVLPRAENSSVDDIDSYWMRPAVIMMLRSDYEEFAKVCQTEFGNRLTYQSHATDPLYFYDYARVRLNYTSIRDYRLRLITERQINSGFFVKIIPLDNYRDDSNAKSILKHLRFWRRALYVKWRTNDPVQFLQLTFKDKFKMMLMRGITIEDMYRKAADCSQHYNDRDCSLVFDSSHQLKGNVFDKETIISNRKVTVKQPIISPKSMDELLEYVNKHYGPCYLNYYDDPDRQLSIWRYDEKAEKLLTVDELLDTCSYKN